MWQRVQTVFLVIAILALLMSLVQPIWKFEKEAYMMVLTPFYFYAESEYAYFPYSITAILAISSITVSIIEIGKFKDRMLQLKLGALNSILIAGTIFCGVYFANKMSEKFPEGQFGLGLFLPAVAVLCNFVASHFIRSDEKKIRDSDRIR